MQLHENTFSENGLQVSATSELSMSMTSQNTVQLVMYANILHVIRSEKVQISHAHSPNSQVKVNTEVTTSHHLPYRSCNEQNHLPIYPYHINLEPST